MFGTSDWRSSWTDSLTSAPSTPKVIVPEEPWKSFKLKQLHKWDKRAKYLQILSYHPLFLLLPAHIRNLAHMVREPPKRSHLAHACSAKTFLLHAGDTAIEVSVLSLKMGDARQTSLYNCSPQERTGAGGSGRNWEWAVLIMKQEVQCGQLLGQHISVPELCPVRSKHRTRVLGGRA